MLVLMEENILLIDIFEMAALLAVQSISIDMKVFTDFGKDSVLVP